MAAATFGHVSKSDLELVPEHESWKQIVFAPTDGLLSFFLVVGAGTARIVLETAASSCSQPFSRRVHHVETTQSTLSRPKPLKPRHRDEGVAVLTPLTHFLALLPEFGITPKLKTPGEPLGRRRSRTKLSGIYWKTLTPARSPSRLAPREDCRRWRSESP